MSILQHAVLVKGWLLGIKENSLRINCIKMGVMPCNCTFQSINSPHTSPAAASTVCPRSSDSFHILMYYIKWVTTSWTYCRYVI